MYRFDQIFSSCFKPFEQKSGEIPWDKVYNFTHSRLQRQIRNLKGYRNLSENQSHLLDKISQVLTDWVTEGGKKTIVVNPNHVKNKSIKFEESLREKLLAGTLPRQESRQLIFAGAQLQTQASIRSALIVAGLATNGTFTLPPLDEEPEKEIFYMDSSVNGTYSPLLWGIIDELLTDANPPSATEESWTGNSEATLPSIESLFDLGWESWGDLNG